MRAQVGEIVVKACCPSNLELCKKTNDIEALVALREWDGAVEAAGKATTLENTW